MSRKSEAAVSDTEVVERHKNRLSLLPRHELQKEAKQAGIRANLKNEKLVVALAIFLATSQDGMNQLTGDSTEQNSSSAHDTLNSTYDVLPQVDDADMEVEDAKSPPKSDKKKSPRFVEYLGSPPIRHSPRIEAAALEQVNQRRESEDTRRIRERIEKELDEKVKSNFEMVSPAEKSEAKNKIAGSSTKKTPIASKFAKMHAKQQLLMPSIDQDREKVLQLHNQLTKGASSRLKALATPKRKAKSDDEDGSPAKRLKSSNQKLKSGSKALATPKTGGKKVEFDFKFGANTPNRFVFGQNKQQKSTSAKKTKQQIKPPAIKKVFTGRGGKPHLAKKSRAGSIRGEPKETTVSSTVPQATSLFAPASPYDFPDKDEPTKLMPYRTGPKRAIWHRDRVKAAAQAGLPIKGGPLRPVLLPGTVMSKQNTTPIKFGEKPKSKSTGKKSTVGKIYTGKLPEFIDTCSMTYSESVKIAQTQKEKRTVSASKMSVKDRATFRSGAAVNRRDQMKMDLEKSRGRAKEALILKKRGLK